LRHTLTCLTLLCLAFTATDLPARPPNLVLIVTDDQGLDSVAIYGNSAIRTPKLDALAREGTRFTRAYTSASSCSVSRSVILTGRHGHSTGMYGHVQTVHHFSTFDGVRALPVLLEERGYRTANIGKYHLAPRSVFRFGEDLGQGRGTASHPISRSTVEMAEASREFIGRDPEQPFFLYFAPLDPHREGPNSTTEPNSFGNRPGGYPGAPPEIYSTDEVAVPDYLPDLPEIRAETAEYYRSVSRVDRGVGRLVEILKAAGQWDNTVVFFLSDNGYAMPGAKTNLYEAGARLPLIIRAPDQPKAGRVSDALFSWADITPTLLDYAGALDKPGAFSGVSQRAVLDGSASSVREVVFGSHTFHEITMYYPIRMVRNERFKLLWNPAAALTYPTPSDLQYSVTMAAITAMDPPVLGKRSWEAYRHRDVMELYDLDNDPDELRNLAGHPDFQVVRQELEERLRTFQRDSGDPWIVKWEYE
jgi:N-sulfoglucosamine sulfohydrolase